MSGPRFGAQQVAADKLSDEELLAELSEYRSQRKALLGKGNGASEASEAKPRTASRLDARRVRQFYANLELSEGASLEQVRASYNRLLQRYAPERHRDDSKKQKLAAQLAQKLTEAYRGLVDYLDR